MPEEAPKTDKKADKKTGKIINRPKLVAIDEMLELLDAMSPEDAAQVLAFVCAEKEFFISRSAAAEELAMREQDMRI